MSRRIRKHAKLLHFLANCDKHTAKSIISSAKPDFINCIAEICYNILQGSVKLKPADKAKLKKYKSQLRKVANKTATAKTKRQLIQKGGLLGLLLKPLLGSLIGPLAQGLLPSRR